MMMMMMIIIIISNGNRTEWSPIRSVIIRMITKSDDRAGGVRFVYHEYDYRPNWTTRSPITVEPRFNEPLFNEVLDITNDIQCPGQSYSKMYGIEPRYNEFFDITNIIRKPERRIYLDITSYNVNTRQKINAELINSQQIL